MPSSSVALLKCVNMSGRCFKENPTCLTELPVHEQCEWFDTQQNIGMTVSQRVSSKWGCFILTWACTMPHVWWHNVWWLLRALQVILLSNYIGIFCCTCKTLKALERVIIWYTLVNSIAYIVSICMNLALVCRLWYIWSCLIYGKIAETPVNILGV